MPSRVRALGGITALFLAGVVLLSCGKAHKAEEASTLSTATVPAKSALAVQPAVVAEHPPVAVSEQRIATNSAPLQDVQPTLTIVYTNNIDGEIEPCG